MKILYISPNSYIGGAEKFLINIIKLHQAMGDDILLLTLNDGELVNQVKIIGVNTIILKSKFKLRNPFKTLLAVIELNKIIKENNVDIIHSTMPYSHLLIGLVRLIFNSKYKEVWFQHGPVGGLLDKIASLFRCDTLLVNSMFTLIEHKKSAFQRYNHVHILPLGFNIPNYQSRKFNKNLRLTYLGRICEWKGIEIIIEAVKKLNNTKISLTIYGNANDKNGEDYKSELMSKVNVLNLDSRIFFKNHQQNIANIFEQTDILVHSSTTPEPFGLVVGEAMAYSTLVIGSNQGGIRDILINGQTGLSFNPSLNDSSTTLANLINKIEQFPPDEIEKLKHNAYQKVSTYSLACMYSELIKIYKVLIKS